MENAIHNGGEHNESKTKKTDYISFAFNPVLYARYASCNHR